MLHENVRRVILEHKLKAFAVGEPADHAKLHARLSQDLNVPIASVRAQAAQVLIFARLALKQVGAGCNLGLFVRAYQQFLTGVGNEVKTETLKHWAIELGMDPGILKRAFADYAVRLAGALPSEPPSAGTSTDSSVAFTSSALPPKDKAAAATIEIRGDNVNYDFVNKRLWRDRWELFVDKHVPRSARGHSFVLTMPGVLKPELEMERWLRLGFTAKNIIGVEGGRPSLFPLFKEAAERLGFTPVTERLEDFLLGMPYRFRVVLLDMTGAYSATNLNIVRCLQLEEEAVFMSNFADRREQREVTDGEVLVHNLLTPKTLDAVAALATLANGIPPREKFMDFVREAANHVGEFVEFPDLRDKMLTGLPSEAGLYRYGACPAWDLIRQGATQTFPCLQRISALEREQFFSGHVAVCSRAIALELAKIMSQVSEMSDVAGLLRNCETFVNRSLLIPRVATALEKYSYQSQVSAYSPRYLSTLAATCEPRAWRQEFKATTRFLQAIQQGLLTRRLSRHGMRGSIGNEVWDVLSINVTTGDNTEHKSAEISGRNWFYHLQHLVARVDGKMVAKLPFQQYHRDIIRSTSVWNRYPLQNSDVVGALPRVDLSEPRSDHPLS